MVDKISGGRKSYQGLGINARGLLDIGCGNSYGRGRGRGFNAMKQKVRGKCEYLGGVVY